MTSRSRLHEEIALQVSEKLGPPYSGGSCEYLLYHLYMALYYLYITGLDRENNQPLVLRWILHALEDARKLQRRKGDTTIMFNRYGGLKR